ncbi:MULTISPECIES: NADPH-dependent F420 reductase [unclassified Solwaraspora]|uniref:NADPH-dependent F420 reductase n=1 Tax=unclassified Solwaraspora TaxID=2627926 RepID=UPI00248AB4E4|nr:MULTISPECIES: NADPH-dependent F420 reductase [unclassified Solwaraspora]WBB95183.1 NADPH-dependent F420 reductase [Solwaraspora sp. WMMA2059]WBC20911.1 NADPH-dependent F420 reductase [Solwaraspora sp. WMMA2080]WFE21212.1 NADPH-dependent F420 reductase [Solwaraspora sp. WMMD937]WJK36977.1 NADPH-dependent F420 reductase [Solwaraspora sp. WMMA2065]
MGYDASTLPDVSGLTVGIIGGTGDQGRGLAYRLARAGQPVRIGSRDGTRAAAAAKEIAALPGVAAGVISGGGNDEVAGGSDLVIIAVPWEGHEATVAALRDPLAGKIVVDCVNPLGFDKQGPYPLPVAQGSAAQQAAALLPDSRVCAAFNHLSAPLLADPKIERIDLDVLICAEDREAAAVVAALAARIPDMRGIYAGRLRNAHQIEAFTANLIAINRRYKAHSGVRVTDL